MTNMLKTLKRSFTVNLQTPGAEYVPLPMHGGLLGLGQNIKLSPTTPKTGKNILLVGVHDSTSLETSHDLIIRAKDQFLSVCPEFTIFERSIASNGNIKARIDHCFEAIDKEKALLRSVDMVFFIAHSQGCVVSMFTLARLINEKKLHGKQFGLIAFAGTMESQASLSIMREATQELYLMSTPSYELAQAYREAVAVVVGCGGRVMAYHSYDDNVVSCLSSTLFDLLPTHQNLAVGLYIPHYIAGLWHHGDVTDGSRNDLMMALVALWLKARNCGHRWDPQWAYILFETTSYSKVFGNTITNAVGNYLTTLDFNIAINMSHCELYTCSLLYLYGVYWMLQPTDQAVTSIPTMATAQSIDGHKADDGVSATTAAPRTAETLTNFIFTELNAARDSLGDLIKDDVKNWLEAFTEFSEGSVYKKFLPHWRSMQSRWATR
ncbi:hypothetical protein BC938DRAFT_479030 [Jimgerdemannia flammicorona]|uniref:YMC020W-like alpha/beta hydrolase domain-containing protein n=1 Tax=Jimgerdemannia flammicorona TaxID=994334 RepID=A0A433QLT0_9FUNG|nr:hypothetical protein BC938DRAFT_479030 [Jimgerdemannia flammicorona]